MTADVVRQLLGAAVSLPGSLAERGQDDGVEIAMETTTQPLGRAFAHETDVFGRERRAHVGWTPRFAATYRRAGPLRLLLADGGGNLVRQRARDPVRPASGEELVEEDAQLVDVGGCRHRLARDLLGTRVLGCEHSLERRRLVGAVAVRGEQLGDAEVEKLRRAVSSDEDVARLDVAVHDQPLVRVTERRRRRRGRCGGDR